jgi:hypothetical protein
MPDIDCLPYAIESESGLPYALNLFKNRVNDTATSEIHMA